jgi:hypothetical protein
MSLHSTSRTSLFRRGLVAVATATTLLAGGLVAAPAAQASSPPVVDVHKSQGTTVTTSMNAVGDDLNGDVDTQQIDYPQFSYLVGLKAEGGTLLSAEAKVTLRKADRGTTTRIPIKMKRTSTGMMHRGFTFLHEVMAPGEYLAGVELSAVVVKPDGTQVRHDIDVDNGKKILFQRATYVTGAISTQETDGRPARITAVVRELRISGDGTLSWHRIRSGKAVLSFDADGPYEPKKAVFIRNLKIGSDGRIATRVGSRHGFWRIDYAGSSTVAPSDGWIQQGEFECGC